MSDSPTEQRSTRPTGWFGPLRRWCRYRVGLFLVVFALGLTLCCWLDRSAYHLFAYLGRDATDEDWYRVLRVMGYAPLWLLAATMLLRHDAHRLSQVYPLRRAPLTRPSLWGQIRRSLWWLGQRWRPGSAERYRALRPWLDWRAWDRPLLLLGTVVACGITAELMKLIARRLRPDAFDGQHVFRPWSERTLDGGGLGLPSGHTAVAFAAAFALRRFWPELAPIWLALAVGCGISRMLAGAHFLSDVFVSMALCYALSEAIWHQRRAVRPRLLGPTA